MKKFVFVLSLLFVCITMFAQRPSVARTYVYEGTNQTTENIVYSWDDTYLYEGKSNNVIYTLKNNALYNGKNVYSRNNIVYRRFGNKIYRGNSTYSQNLIYCSKGNSLYDNVNMYNNNIVCNKTNKFIYRGSSSNYDKVMYSTKSGNLPWIVIAAILENN